MNKTSEKKRGKYSRTFAINVTTAAQQLVVANEKRTCLYLYNVGDATVYVLSAQNLKAADGSPVIKGAGYTDDTSTAAFWILTESGTADVRVKVDGD